MNLRAAEILRRPGAQVLAFIALTTLPKVALALFEDHDSIEAYHRLYAQHLAAGYYDHPGMIGWLIHLSTSLFGDSLLAVRLPTIIGSGFAIGFAFLAGRRMYGESAGRLAAFLVGLVPMTARFAMEATPDGPLLCFWMGAIWSLAHALQGAGSRPGTSPFGSTMGWWLLAGLFTGAAMDSKYSAIFLPAGLLLYLMLSREHRLWLLRVEPYLAAFAALACFWPTVAWNAEHQWQSFAYQGGERIKAAREFTLNHFGLFLRTASTRAWGCPSCSCSRDSRSSGRSGPIGRSSVTSACSCSRPRSSIEAGSGESGFTTGRCPCCWGRGSPGQSPGRRPRPRG
jgi:4-amino-4-deoxy-L-arabinose transferase-like glycosyltransferase